MRLYRTDSASWALLSFDARAVYALLRRCLNRYSGEMSADGLTHAEAVAASLRCDVDRAAAALRELETRGYLQLEEGKISDPEFLDSENATKSARLRKAEQRQRQKVTKRDEESQNVTNGHEMGRNVTNGHAASRSVTPSPSPFPDPKTKTEEGSASAPAPRRAKDLEIPASISSWLTPELWADRTKLMGSKKTLSAHRKELEALAKYTLAGHGDIAEDVFRIKGLEDAAQGLSGIISQRIKQASGGGRFGAPRGRQANIDEGGHTGPYGDWKKL